MRRDARTVRRPNWCRPQEDRPDSRSAALWTAEATRERPYAADEPPEPELLDPVPLDEKPFDASAFLVEPPSLLESPCLLERPFLLESPEFAADADFSDPPELLDPPALLDPLSEDDDDADEPPESPLLALAPVPLLDADADAGLGSLPRESLR